jgi:hypothetical protein
MKGVNGNFRFSSIQTLLQDYSLWKAAKTLKQVKTLLHVEKAHVSAEDLADVFHLHAPENEPKEEEAFIQLLETP